MDRGRRRDRGVAALRHAVIENAPRVAAPPAANEPAAGSGEGEAAFADVLMAALASPRSEASFDDPLKNNAR